MRFRDDLALSITASHENDLKTNGSKSVWRLNNWLVGNKLRLASVKSEVVIFKGKRRTEYVWWDSTTLIPKKSIVSWVLS